MTQHPKRCETCTNDECDFNENRWGSTWHNDIYYFMKKCGCASHSSASEPVPLLEYCDNEVCMDKGRSGCDPENCNYIKSVKVQNRIKHDASHSRAEGPVLESNPCEENGCTDIEICDEMCEHARIYSPAYVRESRQKAREKVLDEALAEFQNINAPPVRVTYIRHVLESLRQQEGKP